MSELVEIFREEVDVNLKEATRLALGLESGAPEREQTEALMRVFHTLKGAARAIGFEEEKTTAHLLEDVYHDLLEGRAEPQAALVDLSLDAVDLIRATVEARLTERPLPNLAPFQARVDAYRSGAPLDSAAAAADAPLSDERIVVSGAGYHAFGARHPGTQRIGGGELGRSLQHRRPGPDGHLSHRGRGPYPLRSGDAGGPKTRWPAICGACSTR
jgi:HPt (histidine-containing phosphotransfer) domain-containing protein